MNEKRSVPPGSFSVDMEAAIVVSTCSSLNVCPVSQNVSVVKVHVSPLSFIHSPVGLKVVTS